MSVSNIFYIALIIVLQFFSPPHSSSFFFGISDGIYPSSLRPIYLPQLNRHFINTFYKFIKEVCFDIRVVCFFFFMFHDPIVSFIIIAIKLDNNYYICLCKLLHYVFIFIRIYYIWPFFTFAITILVYL